MALVTANGIDVIELLACMPAEGAWHAELAIDETDAAAFSPGKDVAIVIASQLTLQGRVRPARGGVFQDTTLVSIVAGKAGLAKLATPQHYGFGVRVGDVFDALIATAGEAAAASILAGLRATQLDGWTTLAQPIGQALRMLARYGCPEGTRWRTLADGAIWIGSETWPDSKAEVVELEKRPNAATLTLGADAPLLLPGYNIPDVGHASYVEHVVRGDTVRTHVLLES